MSTPGEVVSPPRPPRYCPGCGRSLEEADQYCPFCGRPLSPQASIMHAQAYAYRPPSTLESIKKFGRAVTLVALVALVALLVINVVILIWSPTVVLPEAADPAHGNTLFLIVPWVDPILSLFEVSGWSFALYHILLVFAISTSFVWMVVASLGILRKELSLEKPREGHSPLWIIGTVFFAVLAMNFIYAILLILFNVQVTTPDFPSKALWQLLHGLASASVWEELVTRVLYIGVPLLLIDLAYRKRRGLLRYFIGGRFEIGGKELALIWASSGIFALGHIVYWDAWKIIPTWIAGLAFGYLFLRLGLYACIMLHFLVDYLTIPLDITGDAAVVALVLGLLILLWDVLGSAYIFIYTRRMIFFLTGKDLRVKEEPAPTARSALSTLEPYQRPQPPVSRSEGTGPGKSGPPPNATGPFGRTYGEGFYSCSKCGNTQARYIDGRLECNRCGNRE